MQTQKHWYQENVQRTSSLWVWKWSDRSHQLFNYGTHSLQIAAEVIFDRLFNVTIVCQIIKSLILKAGYPLDSSSHFHTHQKRCQYFPNETARRVLWFEIKSFGKRRKNAGYWLSLVGNVQNKKTNQYLKYAAWNRKCILQPKMEQTDYWLYNHKKLMQTKKYCH